MPDSRVEKWRGWLGKIQPEVLSMHWYRAVYRQVGDIVEANPRLPPSHFFTFIAETYVQTQAAAIRRQVETSGRVVSLGTLLSEIAADSSRLTRALYISMCDEHARDMADHDFDRLAGRGAAHIERTAVEADLRVLREAGRPISDYVDRHVAHIDRDPLSSFPTFGELNVAIDAVGEAFNKCSWMLTASSWATLEPVPQYDWISVFRVPWIP